MIDKPTEEEKARCARERGYDVGDRVEVQWRKRYRPGVVTEVSVWRGYTTSVTVHMDGVKESFTTNSSRVRLPLDVVQAEVERVQGELAARIPGVVVRVIEGDVWIEVPKGCGARVRSLPQYVGHRRVWVARVAPAAKGGA